MRRLHPSRAAGVALALLFLSPGNIWSQVRGVDPTAAQVATLLRIKGHPGQARALLTQARGPRTPREMDEVADTLLAIAATFPGNEYRSASTRTSALSALVDAGRGSSGIDDGSAGIPYAGAAARLMRLAETAQDVGIRAAALTGLVWLPDSVQYLPFLAKVAVAAQGEEAQAATGLLVHDTGPAGQAIARALYLAGTVSQWSATRTLEGAARQFGWRRP